MAYLEFGIILTILWQIFNALGQVLMVKYLTDNIWSWSHWVHATIFASIYASLFVFVSLFASIMYKSRLYLLQQVRQQDCCILHLCKMILCLCISSRWVVSGTRFESRVTFKTISFNWRLCNYFHLWAKYHSIKGYLFWNKIMTTLLKNGQAFYLEYLRLPILFY